MTNNKKNKTLTEREWRTLIYNIQCGKCILVLGPDVAIGINEKKTLPLSEILSHQFAEEVGDRRKVINIDDLAHTAQLFAEIESEQDLVLETASFYKENKVDTTGIYENLTKIPFRFVVNATPDRMLIKAFEKINIEPVEDWYNYNGNKREMVDWNPGSKPLIYYLYGSTSDPDSLVISEQHLLEYLISIISKKPPIQQNISSEFRDNKNCFLFIGFGFRNWYLRILLYALLGGKENPGGKASPSFALEEIIPDDDSEFDKIIVLFKNNLKINFSKMAIDEFVTILAEKFIDLTPKAITDIEEKSMPYMGPSAFVCHASEDKEKAKRICEELKSGGFRPWLDKEQIRGGDKWNDLIKDTIGQIDYFIIIQSKALQAKRIGYVNREIQIALDRQLEFRGLNFIIPVKIDDCEKLPELKQIQTIDLIDMDNMNHLLKAIRRDQQRRQNT